MADLTPESAQANVTNAFETYISELKQAGPSWERKPASSAEGEDAWCARQVAEHIASAGPYFAATIAKATGLPEPGLGRVQFPDFEGAVPATEESHAVFMGVVKQLTAEQLATPYEAPQFGVDSVGGLVGVVVYHLNDHAQQLKTLRG